MLVKQLEREGVFSGPERLSNFSNDPGVAQLTYLIRSDDKGVNRLETTYTHWVYY